MTHKTLLFILLTFSICQATIDLNLWERFVTQTTDLTIKGQRMGRVSSTGKDASGYPVYFWSSTTQNWVNDYQAGTSAMQMDFDSTIAWHLNEAGSVYRRSHSGGSWTQQNNCNAYDMKIGSGDHMWFIGIYAGGPKKAYKWNSASNQPIDSGEEAVKVGVTVEGNAWIVKSNGDIKSFDGTSWTSVVGKANDIIIGSDNKPIIVSQDVADEGFVIKKWRNDGSWEVLSGIGGVRLALDDLDQVYVITNNNEVYRENGKLSVFCPSN